MRMIGHRMRLAAPAAAFLLLLAVHLGGAGEARAQWTQPDDQGRTNYPNGNVGVGTDSPAAKLDLRGNLLVNGATQVIDSGNKLSVFGDPSLASRAGYMTFTSADDQASARVTAYLGVVSGTHPDPGGFVGSHTNHKFSLRTNNADRLTVDNLGNVGVGMQSPGSRLVVARSTSVNGASVTGGMSLDAGAGWSGLAFNRDINSGALYDAASGAYQITSRGTRLSFDVFDGSGLAAADALVVSAAGGVGVGTATPGAGYKLDVNGAAHVSGSLIVDGDIAAKFQDVAEWVPSTQKLQAGTVVVLDAARTNHVVASASAYDTKVAGVVSAQPGVILGVAGDDKVKVATTGRVKVKVDATRGAIKVGDLLVTSGVEGVAMKSVPVDLGGTPIHRPGTIIGKALEPLEKGAGEILVLLSLQ